MIGRYSVSCCCDDISSEETKNFVATQSTQSSGAATSNSVRQVSALVKTGIDRSAMLGSILKVLAVLLVVEMLLIPQFTVSAYRRITDVCACSYAKLTGLQAVWNGCPEDLVDLSAKTIMEEHHKISIYAFISIETSVRILQLVSRLVLFICVYIYARQSKQLEQAI